MSEPLSTDPAATPEWPAPGNPVPASRWTRWRYVAAGVLVAAYAALVAFGLSRHEPWRDEAQAWLIARDATPGEIWERISYEGHPLLWHAMLAPLARAGAPFWTMKVVHGVLAVAAVAVFTFAAPFRWPVKLAFAVSFLMAFEYAVVARNYTIGVLLLFVIAARYGRRLDHPIRFALLLALLMHTSVHAAAIALALAIPFVGRLRRPGWTRARLAAVGVLVVSLAVWVALLWPRPGGVRGGYGGLFYECKPICLVYAVRNAFFPELAGWAEPAWATPAAFGLLALVLLALWNRPAVLRILLVAMAGLGYIFVFKHGGEVRHHGLLLITILVCFWIRRHHERWRPKRALARAPGQAEGPTLTDPAAVPRKRLLAVVSDRIAPVVVFLIALAMLLSAFQTAEAYRRDYATAFSGSREIARVLARPEYAHRPLAVHRSTRAASVLAYLPGRTVWYPDAQRWGTYIVFDARRDRDKRISPDEVLRRVRAQFPRGDVLLLMTYPLAPPERRGLRLLFANTVTVTGRSDEEYWLYEFVRPDAPATMALP